jgi:hypothetical protein
VLLVNGLIGSASVVVVVTSYSASHHHQSVGALVGISIAVLPALLVLLLGSESGPWSARSWDLLEVRSLVWLLGWSLGALCAFVPTAVSVYTVSLAAAYVVGVRWLIGVHPRSLRTSLWLSRWLRC